MRICNGLNQLNEWVEMSNQSSRVMHLFCILITTTIHARTKSLFCPIIVQVPVRVSVQLISDTDCSIYNPCRDVENPRNILDLETKYGVWTKNGDNELYKRPEFELFSGNSHLLHAATKSG